MKSKINDLPDQMQKALRNLTEETVEELIIIDSNLIRIKVAHTNIVLYLHRKMQILFLMLFVN